MTTFGNQKEDGDGCQLCLRGILRFPTLSVLWSCLSSRCPLDAAEIDLPDKCFRDDIEGVNFLLPYHPLKISDVLIQEKIDSLDIITEAFVREINFRSIERATGTQTGPKHRKSRETQDSPQA